MAALEVLRIELRTVSWHEITGDVLRTPASQLAAAIVLTILNYATLTAYDLLAFAYIRKPLPRARIALASFLDEYPTADRQHLRQLVRNAGEEKRRNKPPRAYREIFQVVRAVIGAEAEAGMGNREWGEEGTEQRE